MPTSTLPSAGDLASSMLGAAKGTLDRDWPRVRAFAEPELTKLANTLVEIGKLLLEGKITELEARSLLEIHKNTLRTVLLAIQGMGLLAVENAINAALGAVRDAVNGAVGLALL